MLYKKDLSSQCLKELSHEGQPGAPQARPGRPSPCPGPHPPCPGRPSPCPGRPCPVPDDLPTKQRCPTIAAEAPCNCIVNSPACSTTHHICDSIVQCMLDGLIERGPQGGASRVRVLNRWSFCDGFSFHPQAHQQIYMGGPSYMHRLC